MKKVTAFFFSTILFLAVFFSFHMLFQSKAMDRFIWNMNTFQGRFEHLSNDLPKEMLIGAYAFSIRDFNLHSTRTVRQNAIYYAFLIASLMAGGVLVYFLNLSQSTKNIFSYCGIFVLGLGSRLFFAYHTTCNNDLVIIYSYSDLIKTGGNIYRATNYNYSPVWYWMSRFLFKLAEWVPQLYFMFTVRLLLTSIDFATCFVLMKLCKIIKMSSMRAVALFFLNPITIIITGYHGQIDNISILFLLLAICIALEYSPKKIYLGWALVTLGIIVKHQIIQQPLIYLTHFIRSKRKAAALFIATCVCFLLSFGFYWFGAFHQIVKNVFGYSGMGRPYGLIMMHTFPWFTMFHKYLFISLLLIWPFLYRTGHILKSSLIGMLLTLTFTCGISTQSFVLPIALGALQPNSGFFLFSVAASLFLFGNLDELKLDFFRGMTWNYVWFSALIWFLIELKKNRFQTPVFQT